jgi:uncharacterized membrane protein YoaK (UPF0700 family)
MRSERASVSRIASGPESEAQRRSSNSLPGFPKAWLAVGLAWAAGFVDAVGWLALLHVYTSHMTGNTASFGIDFAQRDWLQAFHHGWPLIPFLLGLFFGAATSSWARRKGWHSSFSIALVAELMLLGLFIWLGSLYSIRSAIKPPSAVMFYFLLSMPAAAMGLQTVTVTRVFGLRVYTTYVTGSLAKFAEAAVHHAFWFYDRTRGHSRKRFWIAVRISAHQKYARHAVLTGALWIAFFLGALCGALSKRRYDLLCLLFPSAILLVATIIDLLRPVAAADEPRPWDDM